MSVEEINEVFLNSNKVAERPLRVLTEDEQLRRSQTRSIFTFGRTKSNIPLFQEDLEEQNERVKSKFTNVQECSNILVENQHSHKHGEESNYDDKSEQQRPVLTFQNFSVKKSTENKSSHYIDQLIDECLQKYTNRKLRKIEMNYSHASSNLESINISNYIEDACSFSQDDCLDSISLSKRSIALFKKGSESLVTLSDGEGSYCASEAKKRRKLSFNYVEL